MKAFWIAGLLAALTLASAASAGQVPNPVNAPASVGSGDALRASGTNPQQAADSGISLTSQGANTVLAGPTSGGATAPNFRGLVSADMPASGAGSGTVTSVTSANGDITVATTTTTPVLTAVSAPKLDTGRTISITGDLAYTSPSFDGSGNVTAAGTIQANAVTVAKMAQAAANTMLGNWTGSTANEAANAMPSCSDTGGNHLNYVSGTGITCGASLPNPSASTLGGTQSKATVSHFFLTGISTAGVPSAAQPAATDLSDYVGRTTFTPTIDFVTHGDLSVAYATQTAAYSKVGPQVCVWYNITATPTFTTSAGALIISGPPVAPTDAGSWSVTINNTSTFTWPGATGTQLIATFGTNAGSPVVRIQGLKSGAAPASATVTQVPSGVAITIAFSGCYF